MQTIMVELPDSLAEVAQKLSKADKEKLSGFVQFWLNSRADVKKESALEIMQRMQRKVALQNLSKAQVRASQRVTYSVSGGSLSQSE